MNLDVSGLIPWTEQVQRHSLRLRVQLCLGRRAKQGVISTPTGLGVPHAATL